MKLTTSLILSICFQLCCSASVGLWSASFDAHAVPQNELIDPEVLKARLGTTIPTHYNPGERYAGTVYFCRDENWGPPCFAYYPELEYTCSALGPELAGHVGSVFVEPGIICRMSILSSDTRCATIKFFAWPETQGGWPDLFHRIVPGEGGMLGYAVTHFMCAKCTTCIPESVSWDDLVIMDL
ncbi:hypothetical protein EDB81DRAFT_669984 [Dactylonectria macrodidyma]|uniref:Uncharacterized protein n=1 Tax=Dactylonectria macrodidyma TaxID=307937 RepID=A0A9P9D6Y0_9HYPO|nr:hypothetical protein EDB81DRAFT_669984 [Dactylonectria macrodidyma]